jgi:hypothetical protein
MSGDARVDRRLVVLRPPDGVSQTVGEHGPGREAPVAFRPDGAAESPGMVSVASRLGFEFRPAFGQVDDQLGENADRRLSSACEVVDVPWSAASEHAIRPSTTSPT